MRDRQQNDYCVSCHDIDGLTSSMEIEMSRTTNGMFHILIFIHLLILLLKDITPISCDSSYISQSNVGATSASGNGCQEWLVERSKVV